MCICSFWNCNKCYSKLNIFYKENFFIDFFIKVMRDNGHSKGYGYVCFDTVDQAFTALNRMNRQILASKPINVDLFKRQENRSHTVDRSHAPKPKPVDPSNHATAFPRLNTRLSLFDSQFPTRLPPSTRSRKH